MNAQMDEQEFSTSLDPSRMPSRDGVLRAADKVAAILPPTPLLPLDVKGRTIWCKAEVLQPIGAFKIRGGWHRLTDLTEKQRAKGVVSFSSGNHAQGVAWAAKKLGVKATIVMPSDAPTKKMENTKVLGAKVVTYDRMTEDRSEIAAGIAEESGAVVVPSFDDPWVIEGQGSAGIEAAAQLAAQVNGATFDSAIICCGGGGLASGIALALPDTAITIVEPEGWDDAGCSLVNGKIESVGPNPPPTACDAIQTFEICEQTFTILRERKALGVTVSEEEVGHAMRVAFEQLRLVVEPGGAVALAAALSGKADLGDHTLVTLSGGNVDWSVFKRMIGAD